MEKLMFGLGITVICLSIVFLVLIGLSYVIRLEKFVLGKKTKNQSDQVPLVNDEARTQDEEETYEDSDEIIAVISAAVAAVMGRPTSKIIVKSIKEVGINTPSWALAGRQEQINGRF